MNSNLISFIILILSFFGLAILIIRKIPLLTDLSLQEENPSAKKFSGVAKIIKNLPGIRNFSKDAVLHKILSRIRIMSIKTDHKTFNWLKKLREKSQKEKLEDENYWEEIKNSTDSKK